VIWTLALKLLGLVPGFGGAIVDHLNKKVAAELDGFKVGTEADTARLKVYLEANAENNRLKAAQNGWWGAKLIILSAGLPAALHMGAIFADTIPFPYLASEGWWPVLTTHVVGSWRIPALPQPYDGYQWAIVQSFFLVLPAMPLVGAAVNRLGRR
jgi:hypothetical protein